MKKFSLIHKSVAISYMTLSHYKGFFRYETKSYGAYLQKHVDLFKSY